MSVCNEIKDFNLIVQALCVTDTLNQLIFTVIRQRKVQMQMLELALNTNQIFTL